jgi:hypothetical protein
MKVWIILRQKDQMIEEVSAYFSEDKARFEATQLCSSDVWIGLKTIEVKDEPILEPADAMFSRV